MHMMRLDEFAIGQWGDKEMSDPKNQTCVWVFTRFGAEKRRKNQMPCN